MELSLKNLLNKNVQIFDRWPLVEKSPIFKNELTRIFKSKIPQECCELIADYLEISPTVYSLCKQLNVFDLATEINEDTMNRLSMLAHFNFVFMSKLDFMYGMTNDIKVYLLDNNFNSTMVIFTTEDDVFDDPDQLVVLDDYCLVEEKMFREYLISFDNINKYKLTGDENYDVEEYKSAFAMFSGSSYNRILSAILRWTDYNSFDNKETISIKLFSVYIMLYIAGTQICSVMIIGKEYYVFGNYGGMGFSIFEIHNDGSMSISDMSVEKLLKNYNLGDASNIVTSNRLI